MTKWVGEERQIDVVHEGELRLEWLELGAAIDKEQPGSLPRILQLARLELAMMFLPDRDRDREDTIPVQRD